MAIVVKRRVLRGSKMSLSILRIMSNKMNDTDVQEKHRRYYKWFDGKKFGYFCTISILIKSYNSL